MATDRDLVMQMKTGGLGLGTFKDKTRAPIKIVGVFVSGGGGSTAALWNLYCYTSCCTPLNVPTDVVGGFAGGNPYECIGDTTLTQAEKTELQDKCDYFMKGDYSDVPKVKADLAKVVAGIVAEVGSKGVAVKPIGVPSSAISKSAISDSKTVAVQGSFNETDSDGAAVAVTEGCTDPVHLWLLIFFLPLILYLLYYPWKRHQDSRRRRLRALLLMRARANQQQVSSQVAATTAKHAEENAAAAAADAGGKGKKKYKWDIEHSDQYLWSTSTGGSMKVNFGKKAPPSAPKADASKKVLKDDKGNVLTGEAVTAALAEQARQDEAHQAEILERDIKQAEELEAAGQLGDAGAFWVTLCPCCRTVLEDGAYEQELVEYNKDVDKVANRA